MATAQSVDTSVTADLEALQLEVNQAFSPQKNKRFTSRISDLDWMYNQCSNGELFQLYTGDRSKLTLFDMQTYRQWKSHIEYGRVVYFRRLRQKTIMIQPLVLSSGAQEKSGYVDTEIHQPVLDYLRYYCEAFFTGMTVKVSSPIDISTIKRVTKRVHSSTNREQYLVGDLLKYLKSICPKYAFSIVGVTMVDIYPGPEWNFVLGQASITTGCGVFSFGRYFKTSSEVDRVIAENSQVKELWILLRVMTHELCHIFGIKHCYYFQCSLNESSSISEAAGQPFFACPICLKKLRKSLQFNTLDRYKGLLEATKKMQKAVCEALQVCLTSEQTLTRGLGRGDAVLTNHISASDRLQTPGTSTQVSSQTNQVASRNDTCTVSPPDEARVCKTHSACAGSSKPQHSEKDCDGLKSVSVSRQSQQNNGRLKVDTQSAKAVTDQELPKELWHSEQLEYFSKAIKWLEKVIINLDQFELQWEKSPGK